MTKSKIKELRELSVQELNKTNRDIQNQLRLIRFQAKIEKPKNPMQKRDLRKKLAVVNTLLKEEELKAAGDKI